MDWIMTFGSSKTQVYSGGWIRIKAESREEAIAKFRARYGARAVHNGTLSFAFLYTAEEFAQTNMATFAGNLGAAEHEYLDEIKPAHVALSMVEKLIDDIRDLKHQLAQDVAEYRYSFEEPDAIAEYITNYATSVMYNAETGLRGHAREWREKLNDR